MAYQNGYQTLTQSMNGILSFNDGAGTIIQDGTITTNSIATNNLLAEFPTQTCSLFANATGNGVSLGNPLGTTYVRSYWTPVSGYDVINYAYLTGTYYSNLLGLTNLWTGVSNSFQNVVYASSITGISSGALQITGSGIGLTAPVGGISLSSTTGSVKVEGMEFNGTVVNPTTAGTISLGTLNSASITIGQAGTSTINLLGAATTLVQNSLAMVFGVNPSTYVSGTGLMTGAGTVFRNVGGDSYIDFHSTSLTGQQDYTARISASGGTISNGGILNIGAKFINTTATGGNLNYTGDNVSFTGIVSNNFISVINQFTGLCFDKGSLTANSIVQTFSSGTNGLVIAGNSLMVPNFVIIYSSNGGVAFSTIPKITLSLVTANTACSGVILSIFAVSTTRLTVQAYNANGTVAPAGAWGVSFTAIGGY